MSDDFLWVEKYRPRTIDDCVLPTDIKQTFFDIKDEIPNMILTGTAGTGKTTIAKALCEMHGCDYILINGSEESGIDVLRTKIKNFASTVSLQGGNKVVILDEADYLNPQSTQPALRGFIEEFHKNCRFIFTCNYKNRLIAPLHSRCTVIDFKIPPKERPRLASVFMARLMMILDNEGIKYNSDVLQEMVMKYFPDFRRTINELQRYGVSGSIDVGILSNIGEESLQELLGHIKTKRFTDMRKWVATNIDNDPVKLFRKIYDALYDVLEPQSIPQAVIIIADYSYKNAFVVDQEVNIVACLTELMMECRWK
jgi:DNA polymerase III delta prime subunit